MDRFITKSKYFTPNFNTAIFSDPIRIYFSNQHESQALELYYRLQKRKVEWESYLREQGDDNYCYIMLYPDSVQFSKCFDGEGLTYAPTTMGEDFVVGINGPLDSGNMDELMDTLDRQIGFSNAG